MCCRSCFFRSTYYNFVVKLRSRKKPLAITAVKTVSGSELRFTFTSCALGGCVLRLSDYKFVVKRAAKLQLRAPHWKEKKPFNFNRVATAPP